MKAQIFRFYKYNSWANRRVLQALKPVQPPPKAAKAFSHILLAEKLWLLRIQGKQENPVDIWQPIAAAEWEDTLNLSIGAYRNFLQRLTDEDLVKTVSYRNSKGTEYHNLLSDILTHVFMHGAYHRGQIAITFRSANLEPPQTDYIYYVRENG